MFILLLNQDWFADELRALGHTVATVGLGKHLEYTIPAPLIHIDTIVTNHFDGRWPDVVLIHDNSAPICVVGFEERTVPTIFYSVDAHHHYELHGDLGKIFDHVLVAQRDYMSYMDKLSDAPLEWMPLWASQYVEADDDKMWGAVFVGSLNRKLNPDRVAFFEELEKKTTMYCETGAWWQIFPKSEIVINQTVKGDLNFRVFEAMISGAMLLTERSSNGLLELFEDGKHLVTYEKGNVDEAAEKIEYYLAHKEEAREIAMAGRDQVLQHHCIEHRAKRVADVCAEVTQIKSKPRKYFGWMANCNGLTTRLIELDTILAKQANVHAMKAAEAALLNNEPLDDHLTYLLVYACCFFDQAHQRTSGLELLKHARKLYPERVLIALAIVRSLLNTGKVQEATEIAQQIEPESPQRIFACAEEAITALLHMKHAPMSEVQSSDH